MWIDVQVPEVKCKHFVSTWLRCMVTPWRVCENWFGDTADAGQRASKDLVGSKFPLHRSGLLHECSMGSKARAPLAT